MNRNYSVVLQTRGFMASTSNLIDRIETWQYWVGDWKVISFDYFDTGTFIGQDITTFRINGEISSKSLPGHIVSEFTIGEFQHIARITIVLDC